MFLAGLFITVPYSASSSFVSLARRIQLEFQQDIIITRKPSCCYRDALQFAHCSSCCSIAILDHPSSMIFISSERVRYGQFSVEKTHIFLPHLFNPKFENVSFALHPQNFVCREHIHRTNYSCKKFSSLTQSLSTVHHNEQTHGQMRDRRQWYHRHLEHSCN